MKQYFFKCCLFFLIVFSVDYCFGFTVFLKNGKNFSAYEYYEESDKYVFKIKDAFEVGIEKNDVDWVKTKSSFDEFDKKLKKEEEQKRKLKESKDKEVALLEEEFSNFAYEKRGMQLKFQEDEVAHLLDLGEKNYQHIDSIIKHYTFSNEYLPSVIYTKKLRLVLYGVEKVRSKKQYSPTEIRSIIEDPNLLIVVYLAGDDPDMFSNADIYIEQDGRIIKPFNFKSQTNSEKTDVWPETPAYYWKILANFSYNDIDLKKPCKIVVKKDKVSREKKLDLPSFR